MTDSAQTPISTVEDPFAVADNDAANYTDPPIVVFGQVSVVARYCVFEAGAKPRGRRDFDPQIDAFDVRRIELGFGVQPVVVGRKATEYYTTSDSREFARIVNPSIKALGVQNAKALDGRYVEAHLVDSGRVIKDDPDKRQWKALKFVRLFASEDECVQAAEAKGARHVPAGVAAPATPVGTPAPAPAPLQIATASEAVALKFVEPLWRQSGQSPERFLALLQSSPMTKGLSVDHPEVLRYLLPAAGAGATG